MASLYGMRPNQGQLNAKLIVAVNANDTLTVERLLAAGADPNTAATNGWTPLLIAAEKKKYRDRKGTSPERG